MISSNDDGVNFVIAAVAATVFMILVESVTAGM